MIYIVSGIPRSGTSMIMRCLEQGGFPILVDNVASPDINNPNGYYQYAPSAYVDEYSQWIDLATNKALKIIAPRIPYLPLDRQYKVIFMERTPEETIASQLKFSPNVETPEQILACRNNTYAWIRFHSIPLHIVSYNEIMLASDKSSIFQGIADFIGTSLDISKMNQVPVNELYRNRV